MELLKELLIFLFKLFGAFASGAALGYVFQVPSRYLVSSGFSAAIGWAVYLLAGQAGWNLVWVNYAATVCVALAAQILARKKHVPATVFLIPGIIPLVPGGGMYLIVWSMLYDSSATSAYFTETLQLAGAIALGIFTVDTIFRVAYRRKNRP